MSEKGQHQTMLFQHFWRNPMDARAFDAGVRAMYAQMTREPRLPDCPRAQWDDLGDPGQDFYRRLAAAFARGAGIEPIEQSRTDAA